MNGDTSPEAEPTPAQMAIIRMLTPDQVGRIDATLLANAAPQWRKVARVVGASLIHLKAEHPGLPDVYYSFRITELVNTGRLQSQGDLRRMRFSEVRTPVAELSPAHTSAAPRSS
jgi:hypothetical protein